MSCDEREKETIRPGDKLTLEDENKLIQVNWPPELKKLTFKSKYFKVDSELYKFLQEDGIYIHPRYQKVTEDYGHQNNQPTNQSNQNNRQDQKETPSKMNENEMGNQISSDCSDISIEFREFSILFEIFVRECLDEYGSVFVKLNQRSGRDVENWLTDMRIFTMEELLTALKSSGIFSEVLDRTNEGALWLTLKKWYPLSRERILRCFVRERTLIAISQRHCSSVNMSISENALNFSSNICEYFYKKIQPYVMLNDYVFDVYIDIPPANKLRLIDINPWRCHTNPLLYSWEELEEINIQDFKHIQEDLQADLSTKPIVRFVADESDVIIEDLSAYRVPEEMLLDEDNPISQYQNVFDYLNIHNKDLFQ